MKRKAESTTDAANVKPILRKKAKHYCSDEEARSCFDSGLFDRQVLKDYATEYAESTPYKHGVIRSLVDDALLRNVRTEVKENVHFTLKETDIYKIHQSGDLVNLDGLEDSALEKLPSLLKLRDALYSSTFRRYVSSITGAGDLSGRKTDMAINVYTPGCHLLCHDDVIGSRRVSYILYLTDPEVPWQDEWGGALRLYPTNTLTNEEGEDTKVPSPDFSKIIPPAWNQLSFFAVQPGESFHDVEEVYHAADDVRLKADGGRIRMAISGWYHIPQLGEDGYIEGAEQKIAEKSSLVQLQSKADLFDLPQKKPVAVVAAPISADQKSLEADDIDFLLQYMAPTYLTPDTMDQVTEHFEEQSSVTVENLLSSSFSSRLQRYIQEVEAQELPETCDEIEKSRWRVAVPPHKHRFLFLQPGCTNPSRRQAVADHNPLNELLNDFLPSKEFLKWVEIATGCKIENHSFMGRRFRKGLDYALATNHDGQPQLELSLGITPTPGWGSDESNDDANQETSTLAEDDSTQENGNAKSSGKITSDGNGTSNGKNAIVGEMKKDNSDEDLQNKIIEDDVGGHEVYMAGDEEDDTEDAAIYKVSNDEEDDNVLFTVPASWSKLSIVLRDSGVLRFMKYVSKAAKGDRWDVVGSFGISEEEDEDDDDDSGAQQISLEDSEEEEFNGFPPYDESDSD